MRKNDEYMLLYNDMSGSMAKNRFRLEMLWGINKMFDVYDKYDDFTVVFDNVCDIELHLKSGQEYYQIKSNKVASPKSINHYTKLKKNKENNEEHSIFGKLVLLNDKKYGTLKVAVVSNAYLKDGNKCFSDFEEFSLEDIEDKHKQKIIDKLNTEIGKEVSITNFYYIHTSMNLESPDNDLLGKTIYTFQKIKNCEPKKPNALYRYIVETAQRKAEYEFNTVDYEELISKKGFSKTELDSILDIYCDNVDVSVEKVQKEIDQLSSIRKKKQLNLSLANILKYLYSSTELKQIEKDINLYLESTNDLPDNFEELTNHLLEKFSNVFTKEFTNDEIIVFIMIVITRWEINYYE